MSRTAEIEIAFGGEDRPFRLNIGRLRALQEKVDAGPMELVNRLSAGAWRVDDLRETILQGLIGGGMTSAEATRLMKSDFDDLPLAQFVPIAQAILYTTLLGAEDEPAGEPAGGAPSSPSPGQNSASPASTEAAPS
nr:gene transfer agent family protein [Brevundimonas diminuta]